MDSAPSMAEAPPTTGESGPGHHPPPSPGPHSPRDSGGPGSPSSPPVRKDTTSSTSTIATLASLATSASTETSPTVYGNLESSPTFAPQSVFSVKDGPDASVNRRASRRRTGPLSALQRERAALIRKLGACSDCRRRRVACHPNHHSMTWEEAARKYRSHSPNVQEIVPVSGRPRSPAPISAKTVYHDPQEMELDPSPTQPACRPALSETRIRTPLPSGPRLDKPASATTLPGIDSLKSDLQSVAARILSDPYGSRYTSVQALLLHWQDDNDQGARTAMKDLAAVLEEYYHYTFQIRPIPPSSHYCKSPWRWLSREITEFIDHNDQRDVLKIIYYSGHSYLDANREMILASSRDPDAPSIRWSGIQQIMEDACSDTLIIMDAAYYPSSKLVRKQGVLELIAASASEDHARYLDRGAFTRALAEVMHTRASQKFLNPLSAAELHVKLLSSYPKMIQDRHPEKEVLTSFPSPLHVQISGDSRLPSILLSPIHRGLAPLMLDTVQGGSQVNFSFRLTDDEFNQEAWSEWLRAMPSGVRDVKVEGPYRTLR